MVFQLCMAKLYFNPKLPNLIIALEEVFVRESLFSAMGLCQSEDRTM